MSSKIRSQWRLAGVAAGVAALLMNVGPSAHAAPTAPAISIVGSHQVEKDGSAKGEYNFGTAVFGQRRTITHDFTLRNNSAQTVEIDRVEAPCRCTSTRLIGILDKTVEPGKTFVLRVSLDGSQLPESRLDKIAQLYVKGQSAPAVTVHIAGALTPSLVFSPSILQFESVPAGQTRVVPLTVTMDTRIYKPSTPDPKVNGDPVLSLTRVTSRIDPADNKMVRTYRVTLSSHGRLGRFAAGIYFAPPYYHNDGSVFCSGSVIGSVVSDPPAVAFGSVARGHTASRQILLKGLTPSALAGLSIGSDTHDVKAKLVSKGRDGKSPTAVVQVSVSPSTPGAMLSNVIVATKSGQILKVLVSAWVN